MSSAYWIRLNGTTPATEIAPHTPPTWETWADGGNGPCSFELGRSAKHAPHLLRPGTFLEVFLGCGRTWVGRIEDYDDNEGAVTGRGIQTDMLSVPALDGGDITRTAVEAVITGRGAPWNLFVTDPYSVSTDMGTALGDDTTPLMMAALFDLCAEQAGRRWGQDQNGALYFTSDAETPSSWLLAPGVARFGQTTEGQASHLVGRYQAIGGALATATRLDPDATVIKAELIDLTDRGPMTEASAVAILDAVLAAGKSSTGWVNGITVTRDQLLTIGGTPSALAGVRAGSRLKVIELGPNTSAVIGKTRYTAGDDLIYLEPVNTAPRNIVDVIAAA